MHHESMRSRRLLALLTLTSACAVSDDQEVAMGREFATQVESQLPIVRDPRVAGYVDSLGRAIASRTTRGALQWKFAVVNSGDVNAFALPGGFIYVNRGLIDRADRLDHLAGVLGHEIGHVVERHSVERMKKSTRTNIGVTVLCSVTNICESGISRAVINVAGSALFAKYSREDEAEADSQAVVNVINAGIDPEGIPEFFRVLIAERKRNPSVLGNFFATHPLEEDRVGHTRSLITALRTPSAGTLRDDDPGYRAFKGALASLPPPPPPRQVPAPR
jgi:beta-barrel assembly-enhancing protease